MAAPFSTPSPMATTIRSLIIDQVAGEAIEALRVAGLRAVLLKGASFARWLYDDGSARPYNDVDLLVAPEQFDVASSVLASLGYVRRCPGAADGEQADHADNWDRPGSPTIDLHRTLSAKLGVSPRRCWDVVSNRTSPTVVGGSATEVLEPAALALHVVLHAEEGKYKTLDDLERALARLHRGDWEAAFSLAATLEAVPAFGVGLRLLPQGESMAAALGVPHDTSVELVLQASSTAKLARPFDQVARAEGLGAKAGLVFRELVPTPSFIRLWFPPARRGPIGLGAGYLYRLVWVPWHAPQGLRSWHRARRTVAEGAKARAGTP